MSRLLVHSYHKRFIASIFSVKDPQVAMVNINVGSFREHIDTSNCVILYGLELLPVTLAEGVRE